MEVRTSGVNWTRLIVSIPPDQVSAIKDAWAGKGALVRAVCCQERGDKTTTNVAGTKPNTRSSQSLDNKKQEKLLP